VQKTENRRKKQVWIFNFLTGFAALVAKKYPSVMDKNPNLVLLIKHSNV